MDFLFGVGKFSQTFCLAKNISPLFFIEMQLKGHVFAIFNKPGLCGKSLRTFFLFRRH